MDKQPDKWIPFAQYKSQGYGIYRKRKTKLTPGKEKLKMGKGELIKNAPMPDRQRTKYYFGEMEIGDALRFENEQDFRAATGPAFAFAHSRGWKMTTRWLKKEGYGMIWRII